MAERRLSPADTQKKIHDQLAEMRERKIADARDIYPLHRDGSLAAIKQMIKEKGFTRDQAQEQEARNQEQLKERRKEAQELANRRR